MIFLSCSKGLIGVTEPRRVAAISMSHRVAEEMNVSRKWVVTGWMCQKVSSNSGWMCQESE